MGLTPEEKKAKKEAQRLAKLAEEAESFKKLKREELQREIALQAKKKHEVERTFKELMMKIKEPVYRQDIHVMWSTFERAYDKKNYQITQIMQLTDVADDQFQRTVASFCNTIDTMINKFLSDLEELSRQNDQATAQLLKNNDQETDDIIKDHNTAETHLQLLLYTAHEEADNLAWTMRGDTLVKEDEARTKYANDRENIRSHLENAYNNMWDEYKAVLRRYIAETADNQKEVRKLRRKENIMADVIASQNKKLASSDGILKRLRTELAGYESGSKQAVFRDRRNRYRAACRKLKQRMINGIQLDTAQLAVLVKSTDSTLEWFNAAHKKGEKILRMAALCRKFETRKEKVLPYETDRPHTPIDVKDNLRRQQSEDSLVLKEISTTSGLTRMWHRVAKAELTKRALLRERELLIRENEIMEKRLQELKNQPVEAKSESCLCKRDKIKAVVRPNAVDGALEAKNKRLF